MVNIHFIYLIFFLATITTRDSKLKCYDINYVKHKALIRNFQVHRTKKDCKTVF